MKTILFSTFPIFIVIFISGCVNQSSLEEPTTISTTSSIQETNTYYNKLITGYNYSYYPENFTIDSYIPLQFPNVRWGQTPIKYYLDLNSGNNTQFFSNNNVINVRNAFQAWQNATNGKVTFLEVTNSNEANIIVNWSNNYQYGGINQDSYNTGYSFATNYTYTSLFTILLSDSITIFTNNKDCEDYTIALHE